jgi:hypothetical protein
MLHLCPTCQAPLSGPLLFRTDLRFCASCLSVIQQAPKGPPAVEMLRLRAALKRDPSLRRALARDPQRYWQLQLLRDCALALRDAAEVLLIRDAQIGLLRPRSGRNCL